MSFFGEIIEPISRATLEDWDDVNNIFTNLQWNANTPVPDEIEKFIIVQGKYLINYLDEYPEHELLHTIPEVNLKLYNISKTNFFLCLINDYDIVKSSEVVELLKKYILNSKNVIAIMHKPLSEYQISSFIPEECVIRTISTTKSQKDALYPKLEQPNLISGIPAGIIALRDHLNMSGLVYVCYTKSFEDCESSEIKTLLKDLKIPESKTKIKINNMSKSNIYI